MDDDLLKSRIAAFVAEAADIDEADIYPDENFYSSYGIDSLGIVTIFIDIKEAFGVAEPPDDADWKSFNSVNVLVRHVKEAQHGHDA